MKIYMALLLSAGLAGCASSLPDVAHLANERSPVDGTLVSAAHAEPVVGDYTPRQPKRPANWRELNDRISPANRGGGS